MLSDFSILLADVAIRNHLDTRAARHRIAGGDPFGGSPARAARSRRFGDRTP